MVKNNYRARSNFLLNFPFISWLIYETGFVDIFVTMGFTHRFDKTHFQGYNAGCFEANMAGLKDRFTSAQGEALW